MLQHPIQDDLKQITKHISKRTGKTASTSHLLKFQISVFKSKDFFVLILQGINTLSILSLHWNIFDE